MIRSTLTRRWQTTIPAEVRRALGLKPQQGLVYELRGESVLLRPEQASLLALGGAFKSRKPVGDKKTERAAARRDAVRRYRRTGSAS